MEGGCLQKYLHFRGSSDLAGGEGFSQSIDIIGAHPEAAWYLTQRAFARLTDKGAPMKRIFSTILAVLVATAVGFAIETSTRATTQADNSNANVTKKKRGPVFRANKEQIKQAQAILKTRGFFAGVDTGKLDPDTRAGLKKYQEAESLKVTGTLNKITLEKMGIVLTDKQKAM